MSVTVPAVKLETFKSADETLEGIVYSPTSVVPSAAAVK